MNEKWKELIAAMSDEDRQALRRELQDKPAASTVAIEEITPQRVLADPAFAEQVRRDITALLRGEMH